MYRKFGDSSQVSIYSRVAVKSVHLRLHRPAPGCFAKCSAGAGVETGRDEQG